MIKSKLRKIFFVYFIVIIMLVTLPLNSAGGLNDITILRFRGDYFLHAMLFVPWMFFFPVMKMNTWVWLLSGLLFASGSEAVQYLLPYRAFNINDLVANMAGVLVGLIVFGWRVR